MAVSIVYIVRMRIIMCVFSGWDIMLSIYRFSRVRVIMKAVCWWGRLMLLVVRCMYVCNVIMDSRIIVLEGIVNCSVCFRKLGM